MKNIINIILKINYFFWIKIINLIFFLLLFSLIIFSYNSDTIMFKAINVFDERTQNILDLSEKRNKLMKAIQSLNIFSSSFFNISDTSNYNSLPLFDIEFTNENILYLNSVIERSKDQSKNIYSLGSFVSIYDNDFTEQTRSSIIFKGQQYNAKIKLHGVSDDNWINPKKSYSVKTSKEKYINNLRRFKLILLEEQSIQTLLSYYVSNLMGYMSVETGIVRVRINGVDQGLYFLEEALSQDLLEKNKINASDVIKPYDEWTHQYNTGHLTLFTSEVSNQSIDNYSGLDVGQIYNYKKMIEANTYNDLIKYIDIDKFALFEAMRVIFATSHAVAGDNIKLIYETSSGKFFPYFRMEGYLNKLQYTKLSKSFDQGINDWFGYDYKIKLFPILNQNNNFRLKRNKFLYQILSKRKNIEDYYEKIFNEVVPLIEIDKTNNYPIRWYKFKMHQSKENLNYNFDYIKNYLNYSKAYATLIRLQNKKYLLEINPDSNSGFYISDIELGNLNKDTYVKIEDLQNNKITYSKLGVFFKDYFFSNTLDKNLEIIYNKYSFIIKTYENYDLDKKLNEDSIFNSYSFDQDFVPGNSIFEVKFRNAVTNEDIDDKETYTRYIEIQDLNLNQKLSKSYFDKFIKINRNHINLENNNIIFKKNNYLVEKNLIIPKNVIIESGSTFEILPEKSIIIKGNLKIDGSKEKIVFKNYKKNVPFGVFGILGDNYTSVYINNLSLSGGSDAIIDGKFLIGALSAYNHDSVTILNSKISNNYGDDGLNIKNANVIIKNNLFSDNFADAVDLDFTNGEVEFNKFIFKNDNSNSLKDINGDGLDLSGSNVKIANNEFLNFEDKGNSIGENSKAIILENFFKNNKNAISVKDSSKVFLINNKYEENQIKLELFRKKQIFNQPSAYNLNDQILIDDISKSFESNFYNNFQNYKFIYKSPFIDSFNFLQNLSWKKLESK